MTEFKIEDNKKITWVTLTGSSKKDAEGRIIKCDCGKDAEVFFIGEMDTWNICIKCAYGISK